MLPKSSAAQADHVRHMPPQRFRERSPAEVERVLDALGER
jgi:hypothetical protein